MNELNSKSQVQQQEIREREQAVAAVARLVLTREGRGWRMNHRTRTQQLEVLARIGPLAVQHADTVAEYLRDPVPFIFN